MKHVYIDNENRIYSFASDNVIITEPKNRNNIKNIHNICVVDENPIFYAGISLTNLCNTNCLHCSVNTTMDPLSATFFDLNSLEKNINALSKQGLARVSLTGGEPFLFQYLKETCYLLNALGVDYKINTNGLAIDYDLLEDIIDKGLSEIDISLNDDTDDSLCYSDKKNKAYLRINAIERIVKKFKGRVIITVSSVMTNNILNKMQKISYRLANIGIDQWRLRELMLPSNDVIRRETSVFPNNEYLINVLKNYITLGEPVNTYGYLLDIVREPSRIPRCYNLEEYYIFIQYDQKVYWMHGLTDAYIGDLKISSVAEIAYKYQKIKAQLPIPIRCESCPAVDLCMLSPYVSPFVTKLV